MKIRYLFLFRKYLLLLFVLLYSKAYSQREKDGVKTVSAANTIVNEYTTLTSDATAGSSTITVSGSSLNTNGRFGGTLAAGDLIMIIQMQGASLNGTVKPDGNGLPFDPSWGTVLDYNNCGKHEFAQVSGVPDGTSIALDCGLINSYTATGKTQVIRVPRYTSLTINSGVLTAPAWNGTTGGVLVTEVLTTTTINAGASINLTGLGFRGGKSEKTSTEFTGQFSSTKAIEGAEKGEGIGGLDADYDLIGGRYCQAAPGNAGGGGNGRNAGGGGGANGGDINSWNGKGNPDNSAADYITAWNLQETNFSSNTSSGGGRGGYSGSTVTKDPTVVKPDSSAWAGDWRRKVGGYGGRPLDYSGGRLFLGGGGGAGEADNNTEGAGGNGGGMVYLISYGTLSGAGQIISNGSNGSTARLDGGGGGGGGGTIIVNSIGAISGISILANGGNGGLNNVIQTSGVKFEAGGPGGGGSGGYIAVSNGAISKTTAPGVNGTTNGLLTIQKFPANGATIGGAGITNGSVSNFTLSASYTPIPVCSGQSATLTGTLSGTIPAGIDTNWYDTSTGGTLLYTGSSFLTPSLISNTTFYMGTCPGTYRVPIDIVVAQGPVAKFSYAGTPYCKNTGNPSPTFSGGGTAGTFSATPAGLSIDPGTGEVNLSASIDGSYKVYNTIAAAGSCPAAIDSTDITIAPLQNAGFSYASGTFCKSGTNPAATITGVTGGTFSSLPAGLSFISTATGEIDLSASSLNTYTITYTTPGPCGDTNSKTVTITGAPEATFSYTGTPYCQDAGDPSPAFSGGGTSGTFTSTAGLTITANTGVIDLSASTAGTYIVTNTIAASGTCPAADDTATITITALQNAGFNYSKNTFCQSGINPIPTITGVAGGTFSASPAGLSFVSSSTGEINASTSSLNTYKITYTTPGPCADTSSMTISITGAPEATFSYTGTPYCKNAGNPSPAFSGGGSAGTFTSTAGLTIDAGTGVVNLSASTAGSHIVTNTITASGGCSAASDTATITINALQNAGFSYASGTFCLSAANPAPSITGVAGGTFSATPAGLTFVNTTTGEINLSASALNTYTITYTTPGPCADTSSTTLTIIATPVATFSYAGTPYCQNAGNPSPAFSGSGTAGTFTSTPGLSINAVGVADLSASDTGTYVVTNTIAATSGCPAASDTANITITAVQDAGFNFTSSTFCQTGGNPTPTITGITGGTFSATPAGLTFTDVSTGEINVSASSLNTYTITYTTPGPCANTSTAPLTITDAPVATFSYSGTPYCKSGVDPSPAFSGSGSAGTFTASPAGLNINAGTGKVNLLASTAGSYTVTNTIVAAAGCAATDATASISIEAPLVATFSYPGTPYCPTAINPSPAFSGGGAAGSFSASPAGLVIDAATGTVDLTASTPGTYTVMNTIAGTAVCPVIKDSSQITITSNPPVATFSYSGSPYCQNTADPSPTFSGGGTAGTFTSSAGLSINASTGVVTLASSTADTYMVTNSIAASGGCPATSATNNITINVLQDAGFSYSVGTFCQSGSNPTPTITGVTGGTFSAVPAGLTFVSSTTGEINLSGSSLNTYTITYTTPGPCANTSTATITITNAPVATFSYAGTPYCQYGGNPSPAFNGGGSAGIFSASPSGLDINPGTGLVNLSTNATGTYAVTNTIPAANGCPPASATSGITINPVQNAGFNYSANTFCQSGTDPTPTITGVTGGTFSAAPAGLTFVSSATGEIDLSGSALNTYIITYTTPGPCVNTGTATVTIGNGPVATFSYSGSPYCQNSGNHSPVFSNGGTAGSFTVAPAGLNLNAGTGVINVSTNTAGIYTVTNNIPAANGCASATANTSITINTQPQSNFTSADSALANTIVSFTSQSNGTDLLKWNFGDITSGSNNTSDNANPTHIYKTAGTYCIKLVATGNSGCADSTTKCITITTDSVISIPNVFTPVMDVKDTTFTVNNVVFVPDAFSPNNDGSNDILYVRVQGNLTSLNFVLYNRWGEKIFEISDPRTGWDGNFKGVALTPQVFVYYVTAEFSSGATVTKKGDVSIIK